MYISAPVWINFASFLYNFYIDISYIIPIQNLFLMWKWLVWVKHQVTFKIYLGFDCAAQSKLKLKIFNKWQNLFHIFNKWQNLFHVCIRIHSFYKYFYQVKVLFYICRIHMTSLFPNKITLVSYMFFSDFVTYWRYIQAAL